MPSKKSRSIDRRVTRKVEEAPAEEDPAEEEPVGEDCARNQKLDMVAFCVTCGCNDASQFSNRMLNLRGRFGERTRRCRACVAVQESETTRPAISRWDAAQAVQLNSARGWKAMVESNSIPATAGRQMVLAAAESAQWPADAPRHQDADQAPATVEQQRKKLGRLLGKIGELNRRRSAGDALETTQLAKLGREADVRAELARLQRQQGYVFFAQDEDEEATSDERPRLQSGRDVNSAPGPAQERDAAHRSMAFALSCEEVVAVKRIAEERAAADSVQQPKRKKLKRGRPACKTTTPTASTCVSAPEAAEPLASLMSHFHACRSLYD